MQVRRSNGTAPRGMRERPLNTRRERTAPMSIEIIEQNFSEAERADLGEFEQRFRRVAGGKHLSDWLKESFPGLTVLSKAAMAYANANERKGRAYNEMFAALVLEHARKVSNRVSLKEIEAMKPSFSYLLWLSEGHERLAVLETELDKMPGEPTRADRLAGHGLQNRQGG